MAPPTAVLLLLMVTAGCLADARPRPATDGARRTLLANGLGLTPQMG